MVHKIKQLTAVVLLGLILMNGVTLANEVGLTGTIIEKLLPGVYIKEPAPVATDAVNTGDGGDARVMSAGIIPPFPPQPPPPPPD